MRDASIAMRLACMSNEAADAFMLGVEQITGLSESCPVYDVPCGSVDVRLRPAPSSNRLPGTTAHTR